jgi:hypothetical protein
MTSPSDTAFQATFSDFRLVKGRKVCQIVLEVPIEGADKALSVLGGLPNPAEERWVGVARIEQKKNHPVLTGKDLWRASAECAMACKEPEFWKMLNLRYKNSNRPDFPINSERKATEFVRSWLEIDSRSDIDHDATAAERWEKINQDYMKWQ